MTRIMTEKVKSNQSQFSRSVEEALAKFLSEHGAHLPNKLYSLAIQSVEKPLLREIMRLANHNQSHAAKMLGLNRATLKKKLIEHDMLDLTGEN